jgi:hypothetical protein
MSMAVAQFRKLFCFAAESDSGEARDAKICWS